jgi:starch-binding outer membrane protein, SusD/RagB family
MKNIIKTIVLVFAVSILWACSDDFLETEIQSDIVVENYYKTPGDAKMALTAAYAVLANANIGGQGPRQSGQLHSWCLLALGDWTSDDAEVGGAFMGESPGGQALATFSHNSGDGFIEALWKEAYIGIYRANLVLKHVPGIDFSDIAEPAGYDLQQRYLSEAKFIRAYFYFYLLKVYGGVPIVPEPLNPSQYNTPRAEAGELFRQITKDLEEIIPLLPLKSEYALKDMGRITKGAAQALLAKVYLFESSYALNLSGDSRFQGAELNWQKAYDAAQSVISSGQYNLNTPYSKIFLSESENGPESVFEVQFKESGDNTWHNENTGNTLYTITRSRDPRYPSGGQGWGYHLPTQNLIDAFETGADHGGLADDWTDPRLDATVVFDGEPAFWNPNLTLYVGVAPERSYTGYLSQKFLLRPDQVPNNFSDTPYNLRLIRYADVLLIHAEAAYHLGNETAARNSINLVRQRARNGNNTILPDVTASGPDLLKAIMHERRVELALEGHRFYDLVRWGIAGNVINEYYRDSPVLQLNNPFVAGIHELFPVPLMEINNTNGLVTQNPGY